jgi:hypothetical protein
VLLRCMRYWERLQCSGHLYDASMIWSLPYMFFRSLLARYICRLCCNINRVCVHCYACMAVWLYGCMVVSGQYNSLTGSIPSSLGSLTGLQQLLLWVSIDSLDVAAGPSRLGLQL